MDQVTLRAEPRTDSGTRPARRMRRAGRIPAVVYGRGLATLPVSVAVRDLFSVLHTEAGLNALINLEVDGGDTVLAVAREIQRHPVRGDITHLDFIKVALDVAIQADVGVEYVGTPDGVESDGGFVETIAATVSISALPTEIPSSIEVAIDALGIGDTLKVSDLPEIEGVEYLDDPDQPLVTVLLPKIEEEPEVEEIEGELAEGEEPEEGEAAEGEGEEDGDDREEG
jgi:large subunit ribosomal protein L25